MGIKGALLLTVLVLLLLGHLRSQTVDQKTVMENTTTTFRCSLWDVDREQAGSWVSAVVVSKRRVRNSYFHVLASYYQILDRNHMPEFSRFQDFTSNDRIKVDSFGLAIYGRQPVVSNSPVMVIEVIIKNVVRRDRGFYKCAVTFTSDGTMFEAETLTQIKIEKLTFNVSVMPGGNEQCNPFQYGPNCEHKCNDNCGNEGLCNVTNGACLDGCKPGFSPPDCSQPCKNGTFSYNCSETCINCAKNSTTGEHICEHSTGHCYFGCDRGYGGDTCEKLIVISNLFTFFTAKNITIMCLLTLVFVSVLRSFIKREPHASTISSELIGSAHGEDVSVTEETRSSTAIESTSTVGLESTGHILGNVSSGADQLETSTVSGSPSTVYYNVVTPLKGQSAPSTISHWSSGVASTTLYISTSRHTDV